MQETRSIVAPAKITPTTQLDIERLLASPQIGRICHSRSDLIQFALVYLTGRYDSQGEDAVVNEYLGR